MSAPTMLDGSPVSARLDARTLADLREWRASVVEKAPRSMRLTVDELDMLLRVADDRDALRRELCEMPDDVTLAPKLAVVPVGPCEGCGRGLDRCECNAWA